LNGTSFYTYLLPHGLLQGPSAKAAAAAAPQASKLLKAKTAPTANGSSSSSSTQKAAPYASSAAKTHVAGAGGVSNLAERRSNWVKTGVVALRDLGLRSLEPQVLSGKGRRSVGREGRFAVS
jgi:hypothetical protein